jgi:nucleoside-diphosphate-sugar epimerase
LAAILSATGEREPQLCWRVNIEGLKNVLDLGVELGLVRVFVPSSIAVFGPATPKDRVPQDTVLCPTTMYGVTKVAGELLGEYYVRKHGLDCRGLRYPGIISHGAPPGGGTTDYAVAIFHEAIRCGRYTCFVREDTVLPMMYMPDAIKAAMDLLEAPADALTRPCSYNVAAMSFPVGALAASIARHIPGFSCTYEPDERQPIADSWPRSIDDSVARADWGWQPGYDLERMVADMLAALGDRVVAGAPA